MNTQRKKVMVAMSGGVDSSAAAAILSEKYEAVGVNLRLYTNEDIGFEESRTCCSLDDVEDANKACNSLNLACIFAEKKIREKKGKWNQYVFDFEKKKKSIEEKSDMIMSEMPIKKYIYERD